MNIVFVNQDAGYLTTDMINAYVSREKVDKLALITGKLSGADKLDKSVQISWINQYDRKSNKKKLISMIWGTVWITWLLLTKYRKYYVFYISNPFSDVFCPLLCKNRYSSMIFDIYPDSFFYAGIMSKSNVLYKIWSNQNIRFFKGADFVYTLSGKMKDVLLQYCAKDKLQVTNLWGNTFDNVPQSWEDNQFVKKYNLPHKFIVLYSGHIGDGHNVEILVDIAERLKNNPNIQFIIIGEGIAKDRVKQKIEQYALSNCTLLPYQPIEMLPHSLSCASLGVVSNVSTSMCVPSKTFSMVNLNIPLLCIANKDSEIASMIKKYHIGISMEASDIDAIAKEIEKLEVNHDILKKMKSNIKDCQRDYSIDITHKMASDILSK